MKFTLSHNKNTDTNNQSVKISRKIDGWIFLLVSSFVLLVLIFAGSVFFFNKVSKDEYFKPVAKEVSPEILSREKLNKVLEYFENRKIKTDEILSTPLILPDPSL